VERAVTEVQQGWFRVTAGERAWRGLRSQTEDKKMRLSGRRFCTSARSGLA